MNTTVVTMSPNTILLSLQQYEEFKNQKQDFDNLIKELENKDESSRIVIYSKYDRNYVDIIKFGYEEFSDEYKKTLISYNDLKEIHEKTKYKSEELKIENLRLKREIEKLKKKKNWFSF